MRTLSVSLTTITLFIAAITLPAHADDKAMHHSQMAGMSEMSHPADSATLYTASGVIRHWNTDSVTISHQPVAALNWPAMTMQFALSGYDGPTLAAGQHIDFTFRQSDTGYALVTVNAR